MQVEDRDITQHAARIETLLGELQSLSDPAARSAAEGIVQGLLTLYGEGLMRILDLVWEGAGPELGDRLLASLADDELVTHLLLVHDLHPLPVETRVARALEEVRPYLESHGGNVELLGVDDGVARLRLQGSCSGCPSSTMTLKLAIEEAVMKAAPDLDRIEADGAAPPPGRPVAFVPAEDLLKMKPRDSEPQWRPVDGLDDLPAGSMRVIEVSGRPTAFFKLQDTFYAYRDLCPQCRQSLTGGHVESSEIACPHCGLRYDIRLAGRRSDDPAAHLEPVPLLVQAGVVKVAVHA